MEQAHRAGIDVYAWTIDTRLGLSTLTVVEVDGVIMDTPLTETRRETLGPILGTLTRWLPEDTRRRITYLLLRFIAYVVCRRSHWGDHLPRTEDEHARENDDCSLATITTITAGCSNDARDRFSDDGFRGCVTGRDDGHGRAARTGLLHSHMKFFASADTRRQSLVLLAVVTLTLAGAYFVLQRAGVIGFELAAFREWIANFGAFAPIVFIFIQIGQVVAAPIPGHLTALLGGYLFGPVLGTMYSLVGVGIGSALVFRLSQRYGRQFVERLFDPTLVERFDEFVETTGIAGLFVFVLIPGMPDDAVCFLAGLTTFRMATFLSVMMLGRLPEIVLLTVTGGQFATGHLSQAGLILGSIAMLSIIVYLKRDELLYRLQQRSRD